MAEVAKAFLGALNDEQRAKAVFDFGGEERENWHFIPRERVGLPMLEMTAQQKLLAMALVSTGLGESGIMKAVTIMSLEEVLYQMEGATQEEPKRSEVRERRHPEKYFVSIFGEPTNEGLWGWRVEGHHLSLNFTIKNGRTLRATPSFFGTNPGEVREGPMKGLRVLGVEEECGRSLVKALTEAQFAKAKFSDEAPKEMLTAADKTVSLLPNCLAKERARRAGCYRARRPARLGRKAGGCGGGPAHGRGRGHGRPHGHPRTADLHGHLGLAGTLDDLHEGLDEPTVNRDALNLMKNWRVGRIKFIGAIHPAGGYNIDR
jgi:hypothetical protein